MNHLFVPYELALKLKEKGFDEQYIIKVEWINDCDTLTKTAYLPEVWMNGNKCPFEYDYSTLMKDFKNEYSVELGIPTYQQVIDWFHKKGFDLHDYWLSDEKKFGCDVYDLNYNLLFSDLASGNGGKYNERREALNKAIEEALKLI